MHHQLVAKVRVPTLEEAAKIGDRAIMSVVQVPFHTISLPRKCFLRIWMLRPMLCVL
jgi:hypothetical protein